MHARTAYLQTLASAAVVLALSWFPSPRWLIKGSDHLEFPVRLFTLFQACLCRVSSGRLLPPRYPKNRPSPRFWHLIDRLITLPSNTQYPAFLPYTIALIAALVYIWVPPQPSMWPETARHYSSNSSPSSNHLDTDFPLVSALLNWPRPSFIRHRPISNPLGHSFTSRTLGTRVCTSHQESSVRCSQGIC